MLNASVDAPDRSDILNVGGFNDAVFSVVAAFLTEDAGSSPKSRRSSCR